MLACKIRPGLNDVIARNACLCVTHAARKQMSLFYQPDQIPK